MPQQRAARRPPNDGQRNGRCADGGMVERAEAPCYDPRIVHGDAAMTKRPSKPAGRQPIARLSPAHFAAALAAAEGAEALLPLYEASHPDDPRPRLAVEAIRAFAEGRRSLGMNEVRRLALDAHAAARAAASGSARFAARAAGQAVATWHVPGHADAVPLYAAKAHAAAAAERGPGAPPPR